MSDVSNKMIFVLVILTLVISVFSTVLLVTNQGNRIVGSRISQTGGPQDSAVIAYKVIIPGSAPQTMDSATGKIAFAIKK